MPLNVVLGYTIVLILAGIGLMYIYVATRILQRATMGTPSRGLAKHFGFTQLYALFGVALPRSNEWPARQWEANQAEDAQVGRFLARSRGSRRRS